MMLQGFPKKAIAAAVGAAALAIMAPQLVETLDAQQVMVIQYPTGSLAVVTEPGVSFQGFGRVTKYKRRDQYSFTAAGGEDGKRNDSINVQFNDGGHARISGTMSWEMPASPERILAIHKDFGSQEGVEQQLVRPAIERAVYLSGSLMSSTESSGERRPDLLRFIDDQAQNGVYETQTVSRKIADPVTGTERVANMVEIQRGADGAPKRVSGSPLGELGIRLMPVAVNMIGYDEVVQRQIAERQKQITEVQTAIASAKKAEQEAITVGKQGEAAAAKAKWEQEVIRAREVTKAEQEVQVAKLGVEAADATRKRLELEGLGEANKRRAIMEADGGLDKKLAAYERVNQAWAEAISKYQGSLVPQMQLGGASGGTAGGSAQGLVELMTAKAARDLAIDMGMSGQRATAKKQ